MSYDVQRTKIGRETLTYIEIDVGICSHVFSVAPCTAIGEPCYQSRKTCKDPNNFALTTKTFRFADTMVLDSALSPYFMSLKSVSSAPAKITPGKGLGIRASIQAVVQDQPCSDFGVDPYVRDRSYNPKTQGTFWGKFKARWPYYSGGAMRVVTGYLVDGLYDPANFRTRHYVIDQIDGPTVSGEVTITGKDMLKLLDDDRAQCPVANTGLLLEDITDVSSSLTLTPAGIGDEEYEASGYVCVGREVMGFARTADVLTITRGQFNTTAANASANASVQQCKVWTNALLQDIMYELMTEFGTIDPSFIDTAAWDEECNTWLSGYTWSACIPRPTGVNKLISELNESGVNYTWWDEINQNIPLRVIRPDRFGDATNLDDVYHIVENSVSSITRPEDRLSQVWVLYGIKSPTEDLTLETNYNNRYELINADSQSADQFGDIRVRKVFSRWIPTDLDSLANVVAFRIMNQFLDIPEEIKFELDAKDGDVWTGSIANLTSRMLQDASGASVVTKVQVIEAVEKVTGTIFSYVAIRSQFTGRYMYITEDDMVDFDVATDEQKEENWFICQDDGLMPDGTPGYQIV